MPEIPDISVYIVALERRLKGKSLIKVRIAHPFLLRTVEPSVKEFEGKKIKRFFRLGKRIVWEFEKEYFLIFHLMIAGRLKWREIGTKIPKRLGLAAFEFKSGMILLTEAGTKKRASLFAVQGKQQLAHFERSGIEVLEVPIKVFSEVLKNSKHTLKRSLTDPDIISGIGNAYSDEILHHAKLSPFKRASALSDDEIRVLYLSTRKVLKKWMQQLQKKCRGEFPEKVTAFHDEMAVHGKFGQPCPKCQTPVQRIRYAENEANYCPTCQTADKLLADRSLSRLLKSDWPKSLEELEAKFKKK